MQFSQFNQLKEFVAALHVDTRPSTIPVEGIKLKLRVEYLRLCNEGEDSFVVENLLLLSKLQIINQIRNALSSTRYAMRFAVISLRSITRLLCHSPIHYTTRDLGQHHHFFRLQCFIL